MSDWGIDGWDDFSEYDKAKEIARGDIRESLLQNVPYMDDYLSEREMERVLIKLLKSNPNLYDTLMKRMRNEKLKNILDE